MELNTAIAERRAVKHFDASHKLSDAEIATLYENALLSPTSYNIQHWRFLRITDLELRKAIRAAAWDQAQVSDASELVLICADVKAWQKSPERYWRNAPKETQDMLLSMLQGFYEGREWIQRDEAIRSGAMAAQTLMLTAKALGYDSCPMIGFDQDKVAELVNLPDDHLLVMMLAIGKAVKPANERGGQLPLNEVVLSNTF
ncbi:nitroreductase family protein [Marinobacterium arenosum]|uniref:nitroreductase family protein n=1 Tax=Marinobacterium arenosum TaxID=2862496 RepID=UPI001C94C68C|nr:nitroreductase family protein [Marinobacterium arenosum]MBY4678896.1 nitroreductase family protein [Marinobacterium arenosum]